MELTELVVVGTRWRARAIEDGVLGERLTEFPAFMLRDDVVAEIKRQRPRMLIRGTALGIPQPDPVHPELYLVQYLGLRARLDRHERITSRT